MIWRKVSAVLLDFDGTVAYTAEDVWESVEYGFRAARLELPASFRSDPRNLASTVPNMVKLLYPHAPAAAAETADRQCAVHYRTLNPFERTHLCPGMGTLLETLKKRGIPAALLSNKAHPALERLLKAKGWDRWFDSWSGSPDRDAEVQDKEARLAELAGRYGRENCVYCGASPWDVRAAKRNGILSVGVTCGDGDPEQVRAEEPDLLAETPGRLAALLLEMTEKND